MNSFTGNASQRGSSSSSPAAASPASFSNYQFDFGLGPSRSSSSRPLKDQKPAPATATQAPPYSSASKTAPWAAQPGKPSWTHQPAPGSSGLANPPPSMVGDIFGKSWGAAAPTPSSSSSSSSRLGLGIGIHDSNPNLFGDLLGSALGQSKSNANAPLKSAPPKNPPSSSSSSSAAAAKSPFSMSNLSDSLPRSTAGPTTAASPMRSSNAIGGQMGSGQPMKSMPGVPMKAKKDPFEVLVDFGSKPAANPPMGSADLSNSGSSGIGDYSFEAFQNANFASPPTPPTQQQQQTAQAKMGSDPLDMFFSSSAPAAEASNGQAFTEANDWDLGSEFGGNDGGGATTELEGLPPPPAGITASAAKSKGLDNHKQGQYADAIKWLSWAAILLGKAADNAAIIEVLSCRASCYKEVGEYKKAVADCSKVLEQDSTNVQVLLQRALLYESTEKYRLGAEDLRMVLKIDPGNRLARSTIHRLNKLAD